MIQRIKKMENDLKIRLFINRRTKLREIYDNPYTARFKLKNFKYGVRAVHELYVLMLVGKAINGETVYHKSEKGAYWWLLHAQDISTAIIKRNNEFYTVWYQFSLLDWNEITIGGVDANELYRLCAEGKYDEVAAKLGIPVDEVQGGGFSKCAAKVAKLCRLRSGAKPEKTHHIKPDIVILKAITIISGTYFRLRQKLSF